MRSNLEVNAHAALTEAGLEFDYEPIQVELWPALQTDLITSYEHEKKRGLKLKTNSLRPISYTPDFVGNNWIIETKGFRRPGFDLRWKMFKGLLQQNEITVHLFLPCSLKEVKECIEIIKSLPKSNINVKDVLFKYRTNKRVLRKPGNFELLAELDSPKPKKRTTKKNEPGTVRKRRSPIPKNRISG